MTVYTKERLDPDVRWLTPVQTANYLAISESTCRKLINSGAIGARRFGRQIRVDRLALDAGQTDNP